MLTRMTPRAPSLSRAARRDALVDATVPLVREHGAAVTTAQIAAAAGVAEGTIFRAFDSKDELLHAAVGRACDLSHVIDGLVRVDRSLPLEPRLVVAVGLVQDHLSSLIALMARLAAAGASAHGPGHGSEAHQQRRQASQRVHVALVDVIGDDAALLAVGADRFADLLAGVVLASIHPMSTDPTPFTATQVVRLALHGGLASPSHHPSHHSSDDPSDHEED